MFHVLAAGAPPLPCEKQNKELVTKPYMWNRYRTGQDELRE